MVHLEEVRFGLMLITDMRETDINPVSHWCAPTLTKSISVNAKQKVDYNL